MSVLAAGERAAQLPWLCPGTDALLSLAREPAGRAWAAVRADPGAVLLLLRHTDAGWPARGGCLLHGPAPPALLETAQRLLSERTSFDSPGYVNWHAPDARRLHEAAVRYAWCASRLAERTGAADASAAWVCALLAPLGYLALAAVEPARHVLAARDQAALGRRLLRRWGVPVGISSVVGHLSLTRDLAQGLDIDLGLLGVVQGAIALVDQLGQGLNLKIAISLHEVMALLKLAPADQQELSAEVLQAPVAELCAGPWRSPYSDPLLPELLLLAAENKRLRENNALEDLEREHDRLHRLLERRQEDAGGRLHALKLEALAEFAAGAAHEINNPLAVISGQAQYLLGHEAETARQQSLQKIIGQVQRVHQVLTELMQFARPGRPQRQEVDPRLLMRETALALGDLAAHRQVRLECQDPEGLPVLHVDPRQVRTALECLVRNAIEAAPAGGWACLRARLAGSVLEFLVEDNGTGPTPAQEDHLFDPFYSGRQAGRGRGLGLSTAWRLAREQGGEVRHDLDSPQPTRFILTLPITQLTEAITAPAAVMNGCNHVGALTP